MTTSTPGAALAAIREQIDNMPAPSERTHWGHVGDMNRIVTLLRPILFPGEDTRPCT